MASSVTAGNWTVSGSPLAGWAVSGGTEPAAAAVSGGVTAGGDVSGGHQPGVICRGGAPRGSVYRGGREAGRGLVVARILIPCDSTIVSIGINNVIQFVRFNLLRRQFRLRLLG